MCAARGLAGRRAGGLVVFFFVSPFLVCTRQSRFRLPLANPSAIYRGPLLCTPPCPPVPLLRPTHTTPTYTRARAHTLSLTHPQPRHVVEV